VFALEAWSGRSPGWTRGDRNAVREEVSELCPSFAEPEFDVAVAKLPTIAKYAKITGTVSEFIRI